MKQNLHNVLVTGAGGFVGSALYDRLTCEGYMVLPVVRRTLGLPAEIVVEDINPSIDWSQALIGISTIVHLAARVHLMKDESDDPLAEFRRINVATTLNLARQAVEAGVKRFVFISSIKVNGESTSASGKYKPREAGYSDFLHKNPSLQEGDDFHEKFSEYDLPNPQDAYAISKWEAEQELIKLAEETDMEVVIIRPPLVYGEGAKANFLSMMRYLYKGVLLPFGAIHNQRSLVALDNLVDLIVTCILHPAAANQIFLASDGEDMSTTELLRRTAAALGKPARLVPVPQWLLESGLKVLGKKDLAQRLCGSLQVDISKARDILGWTPPITVDEGLAQTAKYFRKNQQEGQYQA